MPNTGPSIVEIINSVGIVATPLLLILISGIGWFIKRRFERSQEIQEQFRQRAEKLEQEIRSERLQIYDAILEPFILMFTKDLPNQGKRNLRTTSNADKALEIMLSVEYRQTAFKLMLFANDDVARTYKRMMQSAYDLDKDQSSSNADGLTEYQSQLLTSVCKFLLEIRKSVGNENTQLEAVEMLGWMITDYEKLHQTT